jgi:hypothetical protein
MDILIIAAAIISGLLLSAIFTLALWARSQQEQISWPEARPCSWINTAIMVLATANFAILLVLLASSGSPYRADDPWGLRGIVLDQTPADRKEDMRKVGEPWAWSQDPIAEVGHIFEPQDGEQWYINAITLRQPSEQDIAITDLDMPFTWPVD